MNITRPILVTGAAGFIGSYICEELLKKNYTVIAVDDLSLGFKHNIPKNDKLIFRKCDLTQKDPINSIVKTYKPQLIFHLAAWAHEGLSQFLPSKITETNYNAFLNVLSAGINSKFKKIVVFSSMSVYGNQEPPFEETMDRKPVDIYGIAKTAMENATEVLAKVYGFKYVIVRPHNVYGPRQSMTDPYRNVVAIFINRMLLNKPFYIYGNGQQKRAFTYIDDLVPSIIKSGLITSIENTIFNVGPRQEYTINMLAKIINEEFSSKLKPIYIAKRPAEVDHAYCTSRKAEKELGYTTSVDLRTGLKKTIEWAKKIGYQKPTYLDQVEIHSNLLPKTWQKKLI